MEGPQLFSFWWFLYRGGGVELMPWISPNILPFFLACSHNYASFNVIYVCVRHLEMGPQTTKFEYFDFVDIMEHVNNTDHNKNTNFIYHLKFFWWYGEFSISFFFFFFFFF